MIEIQSIVDLKLLRESEDLECKLAVIAHRFDELTTPLMAKIKTNAQESRTLAILGDMLLGI